MHDNQRAVIEILALWSQNYKTVLAVNAPQTACLYHVSVVSAFYMEPAYSDGSPSSDALTHTRAHPPGPMPTLMMSAPERMSSSTISPVTTLPACKTDSISPQDTNLPVHHINAGQGG